MEKWKKSDTVFDPSVGPGGLLIASAHFGAYVYGTDVDYNTVHGLGKASRKIWKWRGLEENIFKKTHLIKDYSPKYTESHKTQE